MAECGSPVNVIPLALHKMDRFQEVPPPADLFEQLLGYEGDKRFVGFFYDVHDLYFCDGETTARANWFPWTLWMSTIDFKVKGHYCFGYDEEPASHMLILDTKSRNLYAGAIATAREALRQQLGIPQATEPLVLSWEEWETLQKSLAARSDLTQDELVAKQEKLFAGTERLKAWLAGRTAS